MNLPLAPLAAAVIGVAVAAGVVLMPVPILEGLVSDSGIASVVAAAEPPLGMTARAAIAMGIGGVAAVFAWLALFILLGTRGLTIGSARAAGPEISPRPVIRRADAHPDANPRAPLLATRDLGEPFHRELVPEETVQPTAAEPLFAVPPEPVAIARPVLPEEQSLPEDLGQPLSAFDPDAILEMPQPAPDHVAPLRRRPAVFDDSERFEIFELTPIRRVPPPPPRPVPAPRPREEAMARPETDATIHALLDRLEKGVVRRGLASPAEPQKPRDAERGLEEALVTLRNLARRA